MGPGTRTVRMACSVRCMAHHSRELRSTVYGMKGLLRFGFIWVASMFLTPYLNRFFLRVAARAPQGSFLADLFSALAHQYSSSLIRSFGETLGEMLLGPSAKGRGSK